MIPAEIHPGPNAGDGRTEPRRTTYKPGDREVELRRCAQCGFFNRVGIESVGDSADSPGIVQNKVGIVNALQIGNAPPNPLEPLDTTGVEFTAAVVWYIFPDVVAGCRFCGSLNSIGKDRNIRDFGTGLDLSNR